MRLKMMGKRIIAMLMAILLLMTMLPMGVLAESETEIPPVSSELPDVPTEESPMPDTTITEEDLTFRSDQITPVRMRENGYSLHSVRFLDKPVHNCLSVTAEIEIREGTPDEFILYLQDLDKWYEAGRIRATEDNPVIGTVKFSKPVSFNAFAIVPSEGDYATSINYKLIGAEIKGSELQSSRNENTVLYTGDNFTMSIEDNRDVTITLSGLVLLDEYPSLINGSKGTKEYQWSVFITSGDHYFSIVTDCPVPVKNFNKPMVTDWEKMNHTATLGGYVFGELDNHVVKTLKPTVTHTADSIIWKFKLDKNQPFDFESDIGIKVNWFDRAHHLEETHYYYGT